MRGVSGRVRGGSVMCVCMLRDARCVRVLHGCVSVPSGARGEGKDEGMRG